MKHILTITLCILAITGRAQYMEMLELEQYQIFDEQLAKNGTYGMTQSHDFYKNGEYDASRSVRYEYKIDQQNGKVLEKRTMTYPKYTKIIYNYDHPKCFYQSSEDYYEVNGQNEKFLYRRNHTYNQNCTNVEYVDKNKDSVVLGSHKIKLYPTWWPSDEYFYDAKGKMIKHLNFTYGKSQAGVIEARLTKEYDANEKWVSSKRDYFSYDDVVRKTCEADNAGKNVDCLTYKFEFDVDFKKRITHVDQNNKPVYQKTFSRDIFNRVTKVTIEKANDSGTLEIVEVHRFSYQSKTDDEFEEE